MTDQVFGFKIQGESANATAAVRAPREEMDRLAVSAEKVNTATGKLNQTFTYAGGVQKKQAEATKESTAELAKLDAELEVLLGRLDPAQRAISQLNNGQGLLTRSLQAGLMSQSQYNEALDRLKAKYGGAAEGAEKSALATAGARRELVVLAHEAVNGDFSRMPGSFMVLASKIGLTGAALVGIVAPIAAVAAGAFILAAAVSQGHKELASMNNALAVSGNYAGQTRGSMRELSQEMASVGTLTIGVSKEIVTQLVGSGRIGAAAIGSVAKLSADYAAATGKDLEKIGPELVKVFDDPSKGAAELNRQMHFLSAADQERIDHLVRIGRETEAQLLLSQRLGEALPKRKDQLGDVERAWNAVKGAAASAWDAMLGIGREQTLEEKLKEAKEVLAATQARGGRSLVSGQRQAAAQSNVDIATANLYSEMEGQAAQTAKSEQNALDNKAAALVRQTSEYYKIKVLQDQIALASQFDAQTAEEKRQKANALYDLNRQMRDVQLSIGAEGRSLAVGRINDATKLWEIQNQSAGEQLETTLKLGLITKQQYESERLALDQAAIARKKSDIEKTLALGGQKELAIQTAKAEMASLDAQAKARNQKFDNDKLIERNALLTAQAELDAKVGAETVSAQMKVNASLDEQISRLRESNAEIGKTKDQVDALKAKEMDRAIALLETKRAIDVAAGPDGYENDPLIKLVDAQIAKMRQLREGLLEAGNLQRTADFSRAQGEEFKRLWSTVEQTGKNVFTHLMSDGKGAFESIGKALKSSVIDLLYQLTVRPWIINIGTSVAGSIGVSTVASGASGLGGIGNGIGGAARLIGGGGQGLADFGNFFGSIGSVTESGATFGVMDALGGFAMANPLLAAGLALGGGALLGGLFGGGGPKASDLSLQQQPGSGVFYVSANNIAGGDPDMNQIRAMNAALADRSRYDPAVLQGLVGTTVSNGSPADTTTLMGMLSQALQGAADSAQLATKAENERVVADLAAAKANEAIGAQRRDMEIELMRAQGRSLDALQAQRKKELEALDESLRPLQEQIYAAQDLAGASADAAEQQRLATEQQRDAADALSAVSAAAARLAATRTDLEIQLMKAQGRSLDALQAERKRELDALDASLRPLQQQIYAAQDLAGASAEAAEQQRLAAEQQRQAADATAAVSAAAVRLAAVRADMEIQLLNAQGRSAEALQAERKRELEALDATLRPLQEQIYAARDASVAAKKAADDQAALTRAQEALNESIKEARIAILSAQDPLGYWSSQVALLGGRLGSGADTVDEWRSEFLAAMNGALTQDQFDRWKEFGNAIQQTTEAVASLVGTLSMDSFSTLVDYTRYRRLVANGIRVDELGMAVPSHAEGLPVVPFDGYLMKAHAGEAVIDADSMDAFRKYGISPKTSDQSSVVAEIRSLRNDLRALHYQVATSGNKATKLMERWDGDGFRVRNDEDLPILVEVMS